MFRMRRRHRFWNVSSLWQMAFVAFHDSHPYSNVVRTLLLKKRSLVFRVIFLLFQMFLREANACPALESLALISGSEFPSVVILEPRYVNSLTSSTIFPSRVIGASEQWFILMCFVFLGLTLREGGAGSDTSSGWIHHQFPELLCTRLHLGKEQGDDQKRPGGGQLK